MMCFMEDLKDLAFVTAPSAVADLYDVTFQTECKNDPFVGLDYMSRRQILIVTDLLHDVLNECNLGDVVIPSLAALLRAHDAIALVIEQHKDKYREAIFVRNCIEALRPVSGKMISQHALLDLLPTFH